MSRFSVDAVVRYGVQAWHRLDGVTAFLFCLVAGCVAFVAWAAVFPSGSGESRKLGTWQQPYSNEQVFHAVKVAYEPESGTLKLERNAANEGDRSFASFVEAHLAKFNGSTEGRAFLKEGAVKGPSDGLFSVVLEKDRGGLLFPRLQLNELSAYDIFPAGERVLKDLGPIHFAPDQTLHPYFSDGSLGFFLDPKGEMPETAPRVPLAGEGVFNGTRLILADERGEARAQIQARPDGKAVLVKPLGSRAVFLENNPPMGQEGVVVENGQVVEVAGRFFEAHVGDAATMAITRQKGGSVKRVYPMGKLFHIVGPLALDGAHQSLGIEYLFQEYLMGDPSRDVPPGELWLTLDERLQAELATRIQELSSQSRRGTASALIMDAQTGAILAMAATPGGYDPENSAQIIDILGRGREPFYNHGCFKRHVIGSVTKAFYAFLALQVMGDQAQELMVDMNTSETPTLFGHELYGPADKRFEIKRSQVDFETYLVQSDNGFQHSLGLLLLAGVTDPKNQLGLPWYRQDGSGRGHLQPISFSNREPLEVGTLGPAQNRLSIDPSASFSTQLHALFGIQTSSGADVPNDRDLSIYGAAFIDHVTEHLLYRNLQNQTPKDLLLARSVVCAPESARMELQEVRSTKDASNVLFGANRNRWTDVKVAEAFSRMMTGKRVEARLVHQFKDTLTGQIVNLEHQAQANTPPLEAPNPKAFATMRRILERVPQEGTAKLLHPTIHQMPQTVPGFRMAGKTGTIDDGLKDDPDSRLFLGTFGLQDSNGFTKAYTVIVYLKTAIDPDAPFHFLNQHLPTWWELLEARQPPPAPVPANGGPSGSVPAATPKIP